MSQYNSLAALRGALTESNPDQRGDAYSAVYEAGLKPSAVLASEVSDETVQTLIEAGVLPESGGERIGTVEYRNRSLELLERIAAATEGGN